MFVSESCLDAGFTTPCRVFDPVVIRRRSARPRSPRRDRWHATTGRATLDVVRIRQEDGRTRPPFQSEFSKSPGRGIAICQVARQPTTACRGLTSRFKFSRILLRGFRLVRPVGLAARVIFSFAVSPQSPLGCDSDVFAGVISLAIALPQKVPLAGGLTPIQVEENFLRHHGAGPAHFDYDWMQTPFTGLVHWTTQSSPTNPTVADAVLAREALRQFTGQPNKPDNDKVDRSEEKSVAIVVLPVKSRDAALRPPHDGKVDPLTVAHWLIADVVRSLRIATNAPLQELHYQALSPIVPAVFGARTSTGLARFEDDQYSLVLDHIIDPVLVSNHVDHSAVGQISTNLPAAE